LYQKRSIHPNKKRKEKKFTYSLKFQIKNITRKSSCSQLALSRD
jgi:hypothetical protein